MFNVSAQLPPLLAHGLSIVFIGTEPGDESLRRKQYYADPSNRFYADLHAMGLTRSQVAPADFESLIDLGIGLDDVDDAPRALRSRIETGRAKGRCFNSKSALAR